MKLCKACQEKEAVKGERYCNDCRKTKLREMEESGYLGPKGGLPFGLRRGRGADKEEVTRETKWGIDQ